jgi:integrase
MQEHGRQPAARRRATIASRRGEQTQLELVVRGAKRGRTRTVALHAQAHDALRRWHTARSTAATDALFVSLRIRGRRAALRGGPGDIVAKHAAAAGCARIAAPHALRHTFCTMLAERGVAPEVIRALAGHVDVRTIPDLRAPIARPPPGALLETGDEHAAARADQATLGELVAQAQ